MGTSRLAALLLAALLALPTDSQPQQPGPPADTLGAPDYLSELARAMLSRRMARHGRDLTVLVNAVVLLQRGVVAQIATGIAVEPRIVRPLPGDMDELNSALPERFFALQDELRDRAKDVADAARNRDDARLAESFGRLTETCVACHSAYLEPKGERR